MHAKTALEPAATILPPGARLEHSAQEALAALRQRANTHPMWDCALLRACTEGTLSRDDFQFVFSQYYLYSKNFSRYIAALIAKCEDDYLRSRLSRNLWEEGGGAEASKRHAEIYRRFLREGLGVSLESIEFLEVSRSFVRQVLDFCTTMSPAAGAAFLALGTEGIVRRLYARFVDGLRHAGVHEPLEFFEIHMACDDDHAETLEQITCSYAHESSWYQTCLDAMNHALDLRAWFFDEVFRALSYRRARPLFDRIQAGVPLREGGQRPAKLVRSAAEHGTPLYSRREGVGDVRFEVERLPFQGEVLDPRVVRIAAGSTNERHHHAHETLMFFIQGAGEVVIDDVRDAVTAGDIAFVPRWIDHQVANTGPAELVYLAVTDFGLASKVFTGDYLSGHRARRDDDRSLADPPGFTRSHPPEPVTAEGSR